MKNLFIITLVMTAFATNSIITRLALSSNLIGPSNFALLRAGSAALISVSYTHLTLPTKRIV